MFIFRHKIVGKLDILNTGSETELEINSGLSRPDQHCLFYLFEFFSLRGGSLISTGSHAQLFGIMQIIDLFSFSF